MGGRFAFSLSKLNLADSLLQDVEASLHCLTSIQEAMDMEKAPQLRRLFSAEILGRLPSTGRPRVRRTALGAIGMSI